MPRGVHVKRVRKVLSEIVFVLRRNPSLLKDRDVKKWLSYIYGIGVVYGDLRVKKFFYEVGPELFK